MHALLNVAVMAARRAGTALIKKMANLDRSKVEQKGFNDYVSEADLAAERAIISCIHKHYPDHAIQAEESGVEGESETVWIIDPLDGTTNFLHGFPVFAVSIGVQVKGRMEHGVVYDPMELQPESGGLEVPQAIQGIKQTIASLHAHILGERGQSTTIAAAPEPGGHRGLLLALDLG